MLMAVAISSAHAGENDFIYVDRMPKARGDLERTLTHKEERGALRIVQKVFVEDHDHALIRTYVMTADCREKAVDDDSPRRSSPKVYVTAIKYLPKKPATFAVAGLHDIYKEVYVVDGDGKVRLYEDVAAQSMPELAEAFKPACVLI